MNVGIRQENEMLSTGEIKQIIPMKEREIEVCGRCGQPLTYVTHKGIFVCYNNHVNSPVLVNAVKRGEETIQIPIFLTFNAIGQI